MFKVRNKKNNSTEFSIGWSTSEAPLFLWCQAAHYIFFYCPPYSPILFWRWIFGGQKQVKQFPLRFLLGWSTSEASLFIWCQAVIMSSISSNLILKGNVHGQKQEKLFHCFPWVEAPLFLWWQGAHYICFNFFYIIHSFSEAEFSRSETRKTVPLSFPLVQAPNVVSSCTFYFF